MRKIPCFLLSGTLLAFGLPASRPARLFAGEVHYASGPDLRHPVYRFSEPVLLRETRRPPAYPTRARHLGFGAEVILRFLVSEDGRVRDIRPIEVQARWPLACAEAAAVAEPEKTPVIRDLEREFAASAAAAVGKWRYLPARRDGQPVETSVTARIVFCDDGWGTERYAR